MNENEMEDRRSFGEYIRKKRQAAGLLQKELAQRLYVTESAVSKWERGLSYPDISMVPGICRELGISEHEFFTACDDEHVRTQAREAKLWRGMTRGLRLFFAVAYAVAAVACFICDLAIFHALDWFWIVFTSLMLAFSLTNLPFLVRKNRLPICLAAATGSLLLLLFSCWRFAGGRWVLGGAAITAACLALPWSWWAIRRFYGKHLPPLFMAAFSVWVFFLLAVVRACTGGNWLLGFAYPIAALSVGYSWLYFAAIYTLPAGPWLKAGVCSLLTAFAVPLGNILAAALTPDRQAPVLLDYLAWWHIFTHEDVNGYSWVNVLIFYILLAVSAVLLAVGAAMEVRRRRELLPPAG